MYPGRLICVLGVSGSGKNTMIQELLKSDLGLKKLISCKTRELREGEKDGVDYYHYTMEQFQHAVEAGEFLEYQQNYGLGWYATRKSDVIDAISQGQYVIKDLDIKGLLSISTHHPDVWEVTRSVFIDIDDETMRARILSRSTLPEEEISKRIATAAMERELAKQICTDVIDGSGTIEEEFASIYAVVSRYCEPSATAFISPSAI